MLSRPSLSFFFFFNDTATTEIYTLSLHDALPICLRIDTASLRSTSALRSGALIFRTSWLKNPAPPSADRSWRAASRSRVPGLPRRRCRRQHRRRVPLVPPPASSTPTSNSAAPPHLPP